MADVALVFAMHQPYRLRPYRVFDIGRSTEYFDEHRNRELVRRVAARCYAPTLERLARMHARDGSVRVAIGITGTLIEQLAREAGDVLDTLAALVDAGAVELLGETYHHSLAALASETELVAQVTMHRDTLRARFGAAPCVFRNTELLWSDAMAPAIHQLGFDAVLIEGAPETLGDRAPSHVYAAAADERIRLLPRHTRLSDDVAFRFSDRSWGAYPLDAPTYARWLAATPGDTTVVAIDIETFGEHHAADTGILDFLDALPEAVAREGVRFITPTALAARTPVETLAFPDPISWADHERDASAWLGNRMQQAAHTRLWSLRAAVEHADSETLFTAWRRLSTSDHLYYMSTKRYADGSVHAYFNPHGTPYDAFIAFENVLEDLEQRVR